MAKAPDGLNILDALFRKVTALEELVAAHEKRFNTLTVTISQETANALVRETLRIHGNLLLAAITPQPVQEEKPEGAEEGTPT